MSKNSIFDPIMLFLYSDDTQSVPQREKRQEIIIVDPSECISAGAAKMIETKHGLESNLVPIHPYFAPRRAIRGKKDVWTRLDSKPCLVSIICTDLQSPFISLK